MNEAQRKPRGDRPFPWLCPNCLKEDVVPDVVAFSIDVNHDEITHALHLPRLRIPKCRSCGELVFDIPADRQINDALRSCVGLLNPNEIRENRTKLGIQQRELADKVGVDEATFAKWESGRLIQPSAMDDALRLHLGLPPAPPRPSGNGRRCPVTDEAGRLESVS